MQTILRGRGKKTDLPALCMEVSGGAIVAMPGNGWKPQDEWIQLQLSGGSIPGKEIEAITQGRAQRWLCA